ncbi:MAG: PEGA domain-containing protein [Sedimentisphaeraceae bacterium JB056]
MKNLRQISMLIFCILVIVCTGCVERELTIKTLPEGAGVELNDEQVGLSPVTVSFNWYGTYRVRIEKEGYRTLIVNKELERPSNDYFPFDLFRDIFAPDVIDSYEWSFDLKKYEQTNREQLIERAKQAETNTESAINEVWTKIETDAK